ncbi:MAG: type III pantothenate kinase [Candidatus Omnitrophica bacterium]|nr:type III pantothenate kinase [Candidatus Omnitrophota bacterium]
MLLAIDIGNTNIDFALFNKKGKIVKRYTKPTGFANAASTIATIRKRTDIEKVILASVVPVMQKRIEKMLRNTFRPIRVSLVGKNINVPLKSEYKKREIGQDRLITAFAAQAIYGKPVLIVDFGTAVTLDAISKKGSYLGGLILPGIKMSLETLSERTALLPKTYLKKTNTFIGKNTESSIRNGMIYGYASLCEGLVKRFKKKLGKDMKVVATGGDATLISKYSPSLRILEPDLALKGLYLLSNV